MRRNLAARCVRVMRETSPVKRRGECRVRGTAAGVVCSNQRAIVTTSPGNTAFPHTNGLTVYLRALR